MTASVPPIAATATPPPSDLARQTRSGWTPLAWVTPPGPTVRPVLTSSKVSSAPDLAAPPRAAPPAPPPGDLAGQTSAGCTPLAGVTPPEPGYLAGLRDL